MKKPKLEKYLIRSGIIGLILFCICFVASLYVTDSIISREKLIGHNTIYNRIESTARSKLLSSDSYKVLSEGLMSEEYGTGLADIDYVVKSYARAYADFAVLYDRDGNVISDPSESVFFKVFKKNKNNGEEVIRLESEYTDDWREIFDAEENAWNEKIGENDYGFPVDLTYEQLQDGKYFEDASEISLEKYIVMDEIYVKGGYFVPGRVHVRVEAIYTSRQEGIIRDVFTGNMTPDYPEKYERIALNPVKQEYGDYSEYEQAFYEDLSDDENDVTDHNRVEVEVTGIADEGNSSMEYANNAAKYSPYKGAYYYEDTSPYLWGISKDSNNWKNYEYYMEWLSQNDFSIEAYAHEDMLLGEKLYTNTIDKEFMHHLDGWIGTIDVNNDQAGPEYVLASVSDYSILSTLDEGLTDDEFKDSGEYNILKTMWIPTGLMVMAVFLAISLVIGGFRYMKTKSAYDMKCYRIETTNAMAHDLKTPLTAISGYAENLLSHVQVDKREYYAKAIISNIEYMDQMIHDILELSKSEDERQEVNLENVKLAELVKEELDNFIHIMEERGLSVSVSGKCLVKTDRKMMKSLVDNLLSNAVKYAKEGSEIRVFIKDKGIIITNIIAEPIEKSAEELVKPYVKGDNSRGSRQGSGVGLTIVENVARKLKYKISYDITDDEFIVSVKM